MFLVSAYDQRQYVTYFESIFIGGGKDEMEAQMRKNEVEIVAYSKRIDFMLGLGGNAHGSHDDGIDLMVFHSSERAAFGPFTSILTSMNDFKLHFPENNLYEKWGITPLGKWRI